jgi:hypothetical protein
LEDLVDVGRRTEEIVEMLLEFVENIQAIDIVGQRLGGWRLA